MGELVALNVDGRAVSPAVRERYLDWLSLPEAARTPPLERDWCRQNGVHPSTVWRWRRDDRFLKALADRIRGRFADKLPDVCEALIGKALTGDVRACEAVLRHIGTIWHFAGDDRDDGTESSDLAATLIQAVTSSDFGRVAMAHFNAVQAQRRAVDAEPVEVEEAQVVDAQEGNGDEQ